MATLHRDTQQMRLMKRAEKVRHMRLSGFTYRQIADHLHVSIGTVRKDMERITVEYPAKTVQEMIAEHSARIEEMMKGFYTPAIKGDARAARVMLELQEQQAKLFHLYEQQQDNGEKAAGDALDDLMEAIKTSVEKEDGS